MFCIFDLWKKIVTSYIIHNWNQKKVYLHYCVPWLLQSIYLKIHRGISDGPLWGRRVSVFLGISLTYDRLNTSCLLKYVCVGMCVCLWLWRSAVDLYITVYGFRGTSKSGLRDMSCWNNKTPKEGCHAFCMCLCLCIFLISLLLLTKIA